MGNHWKKVVQLKENKKKQTEESSVQWNNCISKWDLLKYYRLEEKVRKYSLFKQENRDKKQEDGLN